MKSQTSQAIIEGMLEAVLLVDPINLRIQNANQAAYQLFGMAINSLENLPVVELVVAPEDLFFWEDVASGVSDFIQSESLVRRADGKVIQVERRVSKVHLDENHAIYVMCLHDRSTQRQVEAELEKLLAELRATLESTADGILVTDLDGAIRSYNHAFAELWDLPGELLTQRNDGAIYEWMLARINETETYQERLKLIIQSPLMATTDILQLVNGRILERVSQPQYARGRPIGRIYSYRDITQRLADEAGLQLAAKVFQASTDAVFIADHNQRIITTNPSFVRLCGYSESEMQGLSIAQFFAQSGQADSVQTLLLALENNSSWEGEIWNRHKNGQRYLCLISIVKVYDERGELLNIIGFLKDRTETHIAHQKIEELAFTDVLTGLPNRILLAERINQAITLAERKNSSFALLFLDLDHFKQINDALGHPFGDRVLLAVTERLKRCLRQIDTAARLGGDEFVLLLHEAEAEGAEICARRVLEELKQPLSIDGMNFNVSASIGIALYPNDGRCMDDLIKNADSAMYHVKERGRSDFRFYQRQMNIGLLSRMKLDHAMRQALDREQFRLCYQPQVDIKTGRVVGAEALLRWRDDDLGEVSAGQFIPVAEETGVIVPIGNWVLNTAIKQAAKWNQGGRFLRIAINVSALQFQQSNFVDIVIHALNENQIDPKCIELELTESILIRDVDETLKKLHMLAKYGIQLAIDDFGTGYSSLAYLKKFPIEKLKIDRSFIDGLPNDESDIAIVKAIIHLAQAMKMTVIAEGVETQQQLEFLRDLHCEEIQGFLIDPALSVDNFEAKHLT